ncbi:hypothetical protein PYW07_006736 [Mythimna separata]|uniref:DNA-directed DNA polymerase n=1 Tax=Mythimna separata TaxID=271217 RepID=A0AAD7YVC5_MYTSE|nr:hypothetical protein PYW07_006736 [Mythimna separata]
MTASNAHAERVGSELRAMVQAPPGHSFVGADVDSQELWIAALLGDSTLGLCGGSAFGWAVLAGDKARRTDLHSLTATAAQVSRDHAKVINYARIYGAGQNFAERLLKQFNPTMTISEAKSKAAKMFSSTKGRRVYQLKRQYMEGFMEEDLDDQVVEMTSYQAMRLAKMSGKKVEDMFDRPKWVGGTESDMFNKLEEIAESEAPSTAFLSGRLSRALEHSQGRWGGTRLNWAVQSAAADFLHLMLASMAHLAPTARYTCQPTCLVHWSTRRAAGEARGSTGPCRAPPPTSCTSCWPAWLTSRLQPGTPASPPVSCTGALAGPLGRHAAQLGRAERRRRLPAPHAGQHGSPRAYSQVHLPAHLSRALEHSQGRWGGTRLNWAVQSAAADFLHLMLASMAHLAPTARFCLSFHDEVRYLAADDCKYETALALQITNLLTRAFCSQRVGINDLPLSVAFFTAVEVDQVLRKESNLDCTTPSNPHGLENGYGIPNGESLNIFEVLKKCKLNTSVD